MSDWERFDRITCISLRSRPDRRSFVEDQFRRAGLDGQVEFHLAEKSERGGRFGCFESHLEVVRAAYQAGDERALIFEDDVAFEGEWRDSLRECIEFMDTHPSWEFLMIGGSPVFFTEPTQQRNLFRGKSVWTHAYIISRAGMKRLLHDYPQPVDHHYDDALMVGYHECFVNRRAHTFAQRMELGTDNMWEALQSRSEEGEGEQVARFIQERLMPVLFRRLARVAYSVRRWPLGLRPWLIPASADETSLGPIRLLEDRAIPWRAGIVGGAVFRGLALYTLATIQLERGVGRLDLLKMLLKA